MSDLKKHIFIYFSLLFVLLFTYWGLWNTFFQQDEWASLGLVHANGLWGNLGLIPIHQLVAGRDRILGSLLNNALHSFFPFQIGFFAVFALLVHWINCILVYEILVRLTKNRLGSFFGVLFFTVAYTPSQAVTWISAYTTTLPNALFVLLGVLTYLQFKEKKHIRFFFFSILCFIVSYYFKESSVVLLLFLPIMEYLLSMNRNSLKVVIVRFRFIFLFLGMIILLRGMSLFTSGGEAGVLVSHGGGSFIRIISHAIVYPIIGTVQLFIPSGILFRAADYVGHLLYGFIDTHPMRQAIITILVSDMLTVYLATVGGIVLGLLWMRVKELRSVATLSLVFIILSFAPFIILDRPASSYFESRYYYLSAIGGSFLFTYIVLSLQRITKFTVFSVILYFGMFGYLYKQVVFIKRDVVRQEIESYERKAFLQTFDTVKTTLSDKPIIYIEGDSPGFYGIGDLAVPFQQGMGYTAMVRLFDTGKIPQEYLRRLYLWNINSQGYQETDNKGFGYFYKKEDLIKLFRDNKALSPKQVVGFSYKAGNKKLENITDQIRKELSL